MSDDVVMLTYKEAAQRLGVQPDSVRRRARNRKWHRVRGNDGVTRVAIPSDVIPPDNLPDFPGDEPDKKEIKKDIQIAVLERENQLLRETAEDLRSDRDAWRDQAQVKRSWWPFSR
jgi:hypothetical protein